MKLSTNTAAVTGYTGLVGKHIVSELLAKGFYVKCLSRQLIEVKPDRVEIVNGDLNDINALELLISDCDYLFHCAAELNDESRMHQVNVEGTRSVLKILKNSSVKYLCHISSAGVTGLSNSEWISEQTISNPQNEYEKSKKNAEDVILDTELNISTILLRPVNVMDFDRLGAFSLPMKDDLSSYFKLLIKGKQLAHQVHAEDIARAAIHFMDHEFQNKEVYIVGNDEDDDNSYGKIWNLFAQSNRNDLKERYVYLPIVFGNLLRRLSGSSARYAKNKYSSKKIKDTGFIVFWNIKKIVNHLNAKSH